MDIVRIKYLIIGAGPAGLGAAYRLRELGISDFMVLEATNQVGGLAASDIDDHGFVWDLGGHVHFSHYSYYDAAVEKALGKSGWIEHIRNSQIWIKNRFVPYPFQNNIHRLPTTDQWHCLFGLLTSVFSSQNRPYKNFLEWIRGRFGSGIARIFMVPYNEKVWAHQLSDMGTGWMGERVAPVNIMKIFLNTFFKRDVLAWGPNSAFRFPLEGGSGGLWNAIGNLVGREYVRFNASVLRIDTGEKTLKTDKEVFAYDNLITTIPIPVLTSVCLGISDRCREQSFRLRHSATQLVGLGIGGSAPEPLRKIGWMYFPEEKFPFYRATVLSNYSPRCVPDPMRQWSLLLEMSQRAADPPKSPERLFTEASLPLIDAGFVRSEGDIVSRWQRYLPFGYPIPHLDRDDILDVVQRELESKGIFSRGRFGGWKYEVSNQDHSFMQGVEIIDRLVNGIPETTYPYPDFANSRKKKSDGRS